MYILSYLIFNQCLGDELQSYNCILSFIQIYIFVSAHLCTVTIIQLQSYINHTVAIIQLQSYNCDLSFIKIYIFVSAHLCTVTIIQLQSYINHTVAIIQLQSYNCDLSFIQIYIYIFVSAQLCTVAIIQLQSSSNHTVAIIQAKRVFDDWKTYCVDWTKELPLNRRIPLKWRGGGVKVLGARGIGDIDASNIFCNMYTNCHSRRFPTYGYIRHPCNDNNV